jgi:hypothetical protein
MSVLYTTEVSDLECTAEVDEQFHRVDMDVSAGSEFITCQVNYVHMTYHGGQTGGDVAVCPTSRVG